MINDLKLYLKYLDSQFLKLQNDMAIIDTYGSEKDREKISFKMLKLSTLRYMIKHEIKRK